MGGTDKQTNKQLIPIMSTTGSARRLYTLSPSFDRLFQPSLIIHQLINYS